MSRKSEVRDASSDDDQDDLPIAASLVKATKPKKAAKGQGIFCCIRFVP
jgi:hypothetical protein